MSNDPGVSAATEYRVAGALCSLCRSEGVTVKVQDGSEPVAYCQVCKEPKRTVRQAPDA